MDLAARWRGTWKLLGRPAPGETLEPLLARWRERHRVYHDVAHLAECLRWAAASREEQRRPGEVELALWYHDAIYDPRRSDNEERSAALAAAELAAAGVAAEIVARVGDLVLATRHRAQPADTDDRAVVDVDLAILGAEPERFAAYEAGIRREYGWVPVARFRRRRTALLRGLLARDRLYLTRFFFERLEIAARSNLEGSLRALAGG